MSDEFDPLTLHLRGETSCQTQIWIEIFWTQLFPNFPELTRLEIVVKLAHAIQSVKCWNKTAKDGVGIILFFAGRN